MTGAAGGEARLAREQKPTLAVYGGSFDPVHVGHLAIARAALDSGAAQRVLFMPVGMQPLKPDAAPAPGPLRVAMIEDAIAGEPRFAVSRLELERPGPSYTLDTLRAVRLQQPNVQVAFLCGADQLAALPRWHRPLELLAEFPLLVAARPGNRSIDELKDELAAHGFPPAALDRITMLPAPLVEVSATAIRERVRRGEALDGLVPPGVARLIAEHRLYRDLPRS